MRFTRDSFRSGHYVAILSKKFDHFSAYYDGCSGGGCSWLVNRSLKNLCSLVFVDVTIKDQAFRFIGVYVPNISRERDAFLQRIDPFLTTSRRVILAWDCNAVPDSDKDRTETRLGTNNPDVKPFLGFNDRLGLVDKFRN